MDFPQTITNNYIIIDYLSLPDRFRARKRFNSRERSLWHLIWMPVGACLRYTQDDVLLSFWPPFPPPRINFSIKSSSTIPSLFMRTASWQRFNFVTYWFAMFRVSWSVFRISHILSHHFSPLLWLCLISIISLYVNEATELYASCRAYKSQDER